MEANNCVFNSCPCCSSMAIFDALYKLPSFDGRDHEVVRCPKCFFKFMHPMPDQSFLMAHYKNRDLYQAGSEFPQDYRNAICDKEVLFSTLLKPYIIENTENLLAVDFGAGSGYVVKAFSNLGYKSIGLELNPTAPEKAKVLFGVEVVCEDVDWLTESSVKVFSMFEVLEHMHNPVNFLRKIQEKMAPSGLIIGSVPNYGGLGRILFGPKSAALSTPEHLAYFDIPSLKITLSKAGFEPLFVGFLKPNQVVLDLGLRQLVYKILGHNRASSLIVTVVTLSKRYVCYPLQIFLLSELRNLDTA